MPILAIHLLGAPRIAVGGQPLQTDTRKATALLAYLAVTAKPHTRDALATLLWPELDQTRARGALRRTLSVLHAAMSGGPWLRSERDLVQLNTAAGIDCDVQTFRRNLEEARRSRTAGAPAAEVYAALACAAELYQGDFMAGFSLRDSAEFDEWQFQHAEQLRRDFAGALEELVQLASGRHDWPTAIDYARRWLALDSLHEPAHRQLIQLYAWTGQRSAALRQYQECTRILNQELGVPPLAETSDLYNQVLNHQIPPLPAAEAAAQSPLHVGPLPAILRTAPARPALFGRTLEMETLAAVAHRIESGAPEGQLAIIEGEAGIGKTALAQAFCATQQARGATVLSATCYAGEQALAYAPIVQMLRGALHEPIQRGRLAAVAPLWLVEARRLLPELDHLVPRLPAHAAGDPATAQTRFYDGISHVLRSLCLAAPPPIVFLDDIHHADNATLDLLGYLVRRLREWPACILLTWRDSDVPAGHRLRTLAAEAARHGAAAVLNLARLDEATVAELVATATLAPDIDRRALARRIYAEAEGLPLLVNEYLQLVTAGELPHDSTTWGVPRRVADLLQSRLTGIGEVAQQVLAAAATIGRSFALATLVHAGGRTEDETVAAVEELLAHRLVREADGESFDFTHGQLRAVVYDAIPLVRRRLLHRRVGEALLAIARRSGTETTSVAGALEHHFALGGDGARAAQYAFVAGEQARHVYANREAIAAFERALALGYPDAGRTHVQLGDLHTLQGEYSQALHCYQAAAANLPRAMHADLEHRLGRLQHRLGDRREAAVHYAAAEAELPAGDPRRGLLLADWSLSVYADGDTSKAAELAEAALQQATASGDLHALARVHNILSLLARRQGNLDAAVAHAKESLAPSRKLADQALEAAALNSLALAYGEAGEPEQAIALTLAALDRCVRLGDRHREAALRNTLADLYYAGGDSSTAMAQLKQAVAIFAEIGVEAGPENAEIWKLSEW